MGASTPKTENGKKGNRKMAGSNDDKGYMRGAKGIDGTKGSDYVKWGKPEGVCKVTGSDGGPHTRSVSELMSQVKGKGK